MSDDAKLKEIEGMLNSAKDSIHRAEQVLKTLKNEGTSPAAEVAAPVVAESFDIKDSKPDVVAETSSASVPATSNEVKEDTSRTDLEVTDSKIKTGIFDGEKATGSDGTVYPVDATFASKNRLVKGDVLEINDGADPIIKETVMEKEEIGILKDMGGYWVVNVDQKSYKVLTESITVFDLRDGDKVVINIPSTEETDWAAIDGLVDEYIPVKTEEPNSAEASIDKQNNEITEQQNNKETKEVIDSANNPVMTEPVVSPAVEQTPEAQPIVPDAGLNAGVVQDNSYVPDQDEAELVNDVLDRPSNNFPATAVPEQPTFMNPTPAPEAAVTPIANPAPINTPPVNENLEYASPAVTPAYSEEQNVPINTVTNDNSVNQGVKELDI